MAVKPTLLVLAAGMATRYGSLKQLEVFGPQGETIIDYSVYDAIRAGFGKVVFVIRRSIEEAFKAVMTDKFAGRITVDYVLQELDILPTGYQVPENRVKPWGTGHAVWVAKDKIQEPFAVINGDDFYGYRSFQLMATALRSQNQDCSLVAYQLANTLSPHGAVSRGICQVDENNYLTRITEQTHITATPAGITAINSQQEAIPLAPDQLVSLNLFGFPASVMPYFGACLEDFLQHQGQQDPKAEFFLPAVVDHLVQAGITQVKVLPTPEKWFGITYPDDKPVAEQALKNLVAAGIYKENLWETPLAANITG
jgi:NDP-sugar pyrophosphorylase family protein